MTAPDNSILLHPGAMASMAGTEGASPARQFLSEYFMREASPRPCYAGQLDPGFQRHLAEWHANMPPENCDFYHTLQLPDGTVIQGEWDLRGHEREYLGYQPLAGRRVLEVGPATGWLSANIAREASDLIIFDLPFGKGPELVPSPGIDLDAARRNGAVSAARLRNSWWFTRQKMNFEAKAVYGDIYNFPPDLGRFDTTVFGSILLHLSNPFRALQSAAAVTDRTIIVTDVNGVSGSEYEGKSVALFNITPPPVGLVHWWSLGPSVIRHMLECLGFANTQIRTHIIDGMAAKPPMFTVVGRR